MSAAAPTEQRARAAVRVIAGYGRHRMRGSALLITLVLLLVITVAGVAGMAGTVLQERMAGNLQDGTQVFEATEAALRRCEERVREGDSVAVGPAGTEVIERFNKGQNKQAVAANNAEYFNPGGIGDKFSAQGETVYQVACLIEFNGPLDAARIGGSLSRPQPSGNLVAYTVNASGARAPSSTAATQRPSAILESRVVLRR